MKGTYLIENPEREIRHPDGPGGPPPDAPKSGPGGPPPGGMPDGPLAKELKLVWDGQIGIWTNEVSEEVALESVLEEENALTFVAMAGPAPITWEIKRDGDRYTAVSHRGADIHGNPPVDTVCKVTKID